MMKFLFLLIFVSTSAFPGQILDCFVSSRAQMNGAFQEREKLTVAVKKELRPFRDDLNLIYKKGGEMRALEARYRELSAIKFPKKEVVDELHDLDMKYRFLGQEMTVINNAFVDKVQEIYKKKGIPSIVVTDSSGVKTLELDFSRTARDSKAFEFYRHISERFGVKRVTMSLQDNAKHGFLGFFQSSESRIEMGAEQAISILQKYINTTGKHESRHAMFFAKRNRGTPSIFHTQFHAPGEKLLNEKGMYERYMSAEELYTFSTDLQTLAQTFKGKYLTDLPMQRAIIAQTANHVASLKVIADGTTEFTGSLIKSLTDQLSRKKPIGIKIFPQANGNVQVRVTDEFNRMATIDLVSEAEKRTIEQMKKLGELRSQRMEADLPQYLTSKGLDPAEISRKAQANQLSNDEKAIIEGYVKDFEISPIGVQFEQDTEKLARQVMITSKVRLEKIRKVAEYQSREAVKLNGLILELQRNPSPENIQLVRNQMFRMGKNVKEDYKGFILKN